MDAVLALMNAVLLAFIVSTMLNVGLAATVRRVTGVLHNARWLVGALVVLLIATASFADVEGVIPAVVSVFVILLATQVVVATLFGKRSEAMAG